MKRFTKAVLTVLSASFLLLAAGCDHSIGHEHSFSAEWTSDETYHWHEATCDDTDEVSDKAVHTFGDYVSNNDATTEADGTKSRTCTVCGYVDTVTDEGSKIHVHTYAEEWTSDETYHWHACEDSSCTSIDSKAEHEWGETETVIAPTTTETGTGKRKCTVCEKVDENIEIPMLKTYTVTFSKNDGSDEPETVTQTFTEGVSAALTANTFTREDYAFKGWALESDATSATWADGASYTATEDVTLNAVWQKGYTITFNANGGTGTMASQFFLPETAQALSANAFKRIGYRFSGWALTDSAESAAYSNKASYTATENKTLYAVWVQITADNAVFGDLVLSDGSFIDNSDCVKGTTPVAAVIIRAKTEDAPALGLGIVLNNSAIEWCSSSSVGYSADIEGLRLTGGSISKGFTGFTDGSTGWSILKAACSDAGTNDSTLYPAWNFCNTYGTTNGFEAEALKTGWYLPTVSELALIYSNRSNISQIIVNKAGGDTIEPTIYWSCNTINNSSSTGDAWCLNLGYGNVISNYKNTAKPYVLALHTFE